MNGRQGNGDGPAKGDGKAKGDGMKKGAGNTQGTGKPESPSRFPIIFLGVVVALYCGVAAMDITVATRALETFAGILRQIIPVLVLVFTLMFLIDLCVKPKAIAKHLGSESGVKGWVLAIVAGIIATGPIYVWYSMLADFQKKGMRTALAGVFLYTRSVKLPLLPLMVYYFGVLYTTVLSTYLIIFSVACGMVCEAATKNKDIPVLKDKKTD